MDQKMLTRHFSELFVINWLVPLVYTRKHIKTTNKFKNVWKKWYFLLIFGIIFLNKKV